MPCALLIEADSGYLLLVSHLAESAFEFGLNLYDALLMSLDIHPDVHKEPHDGLFSFDQNPDAISWQTSRKQRDTHLFHVTPHSDTTPPLLADVPRPRATLVAPSDIPWCHVVSRCEGSALWFVAWMGMSVREWALREGWNNGKRVEKTRPRVFWWRR